MRAESLVPLLLVAGLGAGCASDPHQGAEQASAAEAASVPERDLTLQAPAGRPVEIASPVELVRPASSAGDDRQGPRPLPAPSTPALARAAGSGDSAANAKLIHRALGAIAAEAAPTLAKARPAGRPAELMPEPAEEGTAGAGRELAPGKTVTLIPVSSDPAIEAEGGGAWLPERQPGVVRGGGHCPRPRGVRGAGIAGRFPVAFPARRLR